MTKPCAHCKATMPRPDGMSDYVWAQKRYCSMTCKGRASAPKAVAKRDPVADWMYSTGEPPAEVVAEIEAAKREIRSRHMLGELFAVGE